MSLKERLTEDMKQALKEKEVGKLRLSVIRMVRANIKNVEIDRKQELSEDEVLDVLAKEVKMRRDSIEEFKKGDRPDLVETLEREIVILMNYLPEQLSETEVRTLVASAVAESHAVSPKEMGKVMAVANKEMAGKADGKAISEAIKAILA